MICIYCQSVLHIAQAGKQCRKTLYFGSLFLYHSVCRNPAYPPSTFQLDSLCTINVCMRIVQQDRDHTSSCLTLTKYQLDTYYIHW
jgi:hypothetical protein